MPAFDRAAFLFQAARKDDSLKPGQEWVLESGVEIEAGPVICFVQENGEIGIDIPCSAKDLEIFTEDRRSLAIHLTKSSRLNSNGVRAFQTRLALKDLNHEAIFYFFIDEILNFLDENPHTGPQDVAGQLAKWRRLFAGAKHAPISPETEVGLLAELEVLIGLFEDNSPHPLESWFGPQSGKHDFEFSDCAVECKATSSAERLLATIHGADQLDTLNDKPLVLVFRRYERHLDGPISIPNLIEKLNAFSEFDVERFIEQTQEFGIDFFSKQNRQKFGSYFAVDVHEFEITPDFPQVKLVNDQNRIQNLSYSIDLAGPASVPGHRDFSTYIR
ncbi:MULTISPECIES: PD-(D/E)XK motif protein [Corynebacterium]|uniref:PD-(D/E)XK motif protein n=1 Tax=Corynebacterium TaxID=1716 RepID=UPI00257FE424|nr:MULTISPECIES: PD-(D/E)XK motif protein [Corynebacterium]